MHFKILTHYFICIQRSYFIVNDDLHRKITEVAMSSPLGRVFTNICLYTVEINSLKCCKYNYLWNSQHCLYRYVDDMLTVFFMNKYASIYSMYLSFYALIKNCIRKQNNTSLQFSTYEYKIRK